MLISEIEGLEYKGVCTDTLSYSIAVLKTMEFDVSSKETFINSILEDENAFYYQILNKRLEYFDFKTYLGVEDNESMINLKNILYALFDLLGVDNPGRVVLFLIDVISFIKSKEITLIDGNTYIYILKDLYPDGFYTDETCTMIIDNYLKPKKVELAEYY